MSSDREKLLDNPLSEVSATAFILGSIFGLSTTLAFFLIFKPLYIYVAFVALFHFLEYYITSKYQPSKVTADSFLINNGLEYLMAHSLALVETMLELYLFPSFKHSFNFIKWVGLVLTVLGQSIRTTAMITSGENFSHMIEDERKSSHTLVTTGIYGYFRHPSYAGFFYWAIGTQLLLLNPISFVLFLLMLYKFFGQRIKYEETTLIKFFGKRYIDYRANVPVRIPFL